MKLSKNMLAVLANFSQVNPSIFIQKGKELTVVETRKTMFAVATFKNEVDVFDANYPIYNLSVLLQSIKAFETADGQSTLEKLDDSYASIKDFSGEKTVKFALGHMEYVSRLKDGWESLRFEDEGGAKPADTSFTATQSQIDALRTQATILDLAELNIVKENDNVVLTGVGENSGSSQVKIVCGKHEEGDFRNEGYRFRLSNLKLMPGNDYLIRLGEDQSAWICENEDYKIEYYVARETPKNLSN